MESRRRSAAGPGLLKTHAPARSSTIASTFCSAAARTCWISTIGSASNILIRFEDTIRFVDARGNHYGLRGTPGLAAPLHLASSLLRFSVLTVRERLELLRAMTTMMRLGTSGRLALADVPFGQWLREHCQSESLIAKLYEPILIGSLNEDPRRASSAYAIQVFRDGLLSNSAGYRLGLPDCPLAKLYEKIPCNDVRLGTRVSELLWENDRVTGTRFQSGQELLADAVVLATNHHAVQRLVPRELAARDSRCSRLDEFESVPILARTSFSTVRSSTSPTRLFFKAPSSGSSAKTRKVARYMASSAPPDNGPMSRARRPATI